MSYRLPILFLLFSLITACSPRVGDVIEPPDVTLAEARPFEARGAVIAVRRFGDATTGSPLVLFKGKEVKSSSSIIPKVERAVTDLFTKLGFEIDDTAPLLVSGEIRQWQSNVASSGMVTKADSEASIFIEVLDPANKRIYSGLYSGNASYQHPNLKQDDIRSSLGTSMSEAINQIANDKNLLEILSSF